MLTVFPKFDYK